MTRLTVMTIKNGDARVRAIKGKDGWRGLIDLWKNERFHTPLLSTNEGVYKKKKETLTEMNKILRSILDFDLNAVDGNPETQKGT